MERFSHREGFLSGFSSQRFFASPNTSSHRDSDVDFADVFGGPPRRSSNSSHERRCSFSESTESRASSSRNPWTGPMEKPVFGEEVSNTRRRTSHNFFDDIYKGSDCSSSPRKNERDSIFSMTGIGALSPSEPLPPAEPLSSSLPVQFSLPAKLVKGTELPTYSLGNLNHQRNKDGASNEINNCSYSPLSRSSSQTDRVEEDLSNHVQAVFHQSSLSKNLSPNSLELSNLTTLDVTEEVSSSKMDSGSSDTLINGGKFHFFIYIWASKGVPIAMPLRGRIRSRLKETGKVVTFSSVRQTASEGMERESPTETPNDFDFFCLANKMSTNTMSTMIQLDKENVTLFDGISSGRVEGTQTFEEELCPKTESETISTLRIIGEDIPGSNACAAAEERKSQSLFEMDLHVQPEQDTSVFKKKAPKTEFNTLGSLLCDDNDGQGNGKMAAKNAVKESKPKTTKKVSAFIHSNKNAEKHNRGKTMPDTAEVGKDSLLDTATTSEGNPGTNRMKRKVKEFVKIFNQDSFSKSKPGINSQSHISRWKDRDTFTKEDDLIPTTKTAEENMHVPNVNQWKTPETFTKTTDSYLQTEKQDYHVQPNNYLPDDTCTRQINSPVSTATSIFDGLEDFGVESVDADELFSGNFQIKELPQDNDKLAQTGIYHEEIQVINAKIRQWSSGKDGNIRSLLSTLQYVLWPESGWQPVPLVDIIEGKGVRRSYQKALLCLHPDKLQQKGASPQQKYIAEKVFDILQDAWTHFNSSLGSL